MSYSKTLTIAALMGGAAFISAPAFAGCQTTCDSHSAHSHSGYSSSTHSHSSNQGQPLSSWRASSSYVAPSSYASGSSYTSSSSYSSAPVYSSNSSYGSVAANCPSGTTAQADGTCLDTSGSYSSSSYSVPSSSYTSSSYGAPSSSYVSSGSASYGSGSISQSYTLNDTTVVPFTGSTSVLGLGSNEQLVPTNCPVSVHNPGGGKVLGCYAVAKPAPVVRPAPVINYTRVVRPVIYVRYPVPTPVPYIQDVYVGNQCGGNFSRYGAGYPGRCGW